jgi:hypothetical protein
VIGAQRFVEAFERLSDRSRYRRFLSARRRLSTVEVRYLTEVDHRDHEALVAIDAESGSGVGSRYVRSKTDRRVAEDGRSPSSMIGRGGASADV